MNSWFTFEKLFLFHLSVMFEKPSFSERRYFPFDGCSKTPMYHKKAWRVVFNIVDGALPHIK